MTSRPRLNTRCGSAELPVRRSRPSSLSASVLRCHARPTAKRLRKNELVVLDLGAILAHYCSDITRTVYVGRAPARVKQWYRAVLEAQIAAIAAVRAGVSCGDVDAAARQVLAGYKLDRLFTHSTGHGLGLEVHEDPRVARGQKVRLEPGFVITIEPGVYMA